MLSVAPQSPRWTESLGHPVRSVNTLRGGLTPLARPDLPSVRRYREHLVATAGWLAASAGRGAGSSAHYSVVSGWSAPYPETTGYLIPTLLRLHGVMPELGCHRVADDLGTWLLGIQADGGFWRGGLHRTSHIGVPSVFNTAQVLRGLVALSAETPDPRWLSAAQKGATWLASAVDRNGLWPAGDYKSDVMPSYYSYAASAMLDVGLQTRDRFVQQAAERVLDAIAGRCGTNGAFAGWAFASSGPAFTHTIAYTLQGFVESAEMLGDWPRYGALVETALQRLIRHAELRGGALPGRLTDEWKPASRSVCLTGNAQVALCLLAWDARHPDLRLVNAAAKLIDYVCDTQRLRSPLRGVRGGVGGSSPIWGRYMTLRYPNWSAKYHCDALMTLIDRLRCEA